MYVVTNRHENRLNMDTLLHIYDHCSCLEGKNKTLANSLLLTVYLHR